MLVRISLNSNEKEQNTMKKYGTIILRDHFREQLIHARDVLEISQKEMA